MIHVPVVIWRKPFASYRCFFPTALVKQLWKAQLHFEEEFIEQPPPEFHFITASINLSQNFLSTKGVREGSCNNCKCHSFDKWTRCCSTPSDKIRALKEFFLFLLHPVGLIINIFKRNCFSTLKKINGETNFQPKRSKSSEKKVLQKKIRKRKSALAYFG